MKNEVYTQDAPKPIGPYSQGIISNGMLYTAGQIAIDPTSGEVKTEDIGKETQLVMKNLEAILDEAGLDFSNVVKCTIFLSDLTNFARVNEVYGAYFESPYPVRETVEVKRLPKDVNVEISLIAAFG
jgi:2-iminobutanoate/2-iminopropanoate deaminase